MTLRITAAQYQELMARRRGGQAAQPAAAAQPKKRAPKKQAQKKTHPGLPSVPEPPDLEPLLRGLVGVGRTWTILMPYAEKLLNSNQRWNHWRPKYELTQQLRAHATQMIAVHRLPRLQRAAVYNVLHPRPIERQRDPGNWAETAKAYVDGLVTPNPHLPTERHLLPDDDHTHLLGPFPVMGPPVTTGYARMSLVIVELLEPPTSGNAETVTGIPTSTYRT
ncbi:hypothetical protein ABZ468_08070 [Streptomyces sp. NPDC005708]|uniref:hypothetical protein n=1 Tax=Streptomyces sp. NPDC005708 TaxID=3154564 RepID=UPI0033F28260